MAQNPVFNRIERQMSRGGYASFGAQSRPSAGYGVQDDLSAEQLQDLYNGPAAGPSQRGLLTTDDVVVKTLGLFAIVLVSGAVSWFAVAADAGLVLPLWIGGMVGTLGLGFAIMLKKTISVPLILAYAVLEGVFVGSISTVFEQRWPGVVTTAIVATTATFAGIFLAYRTGLIKVNDKFRRIFGMALIGYFFFAMANFVASLMGVGHGWGFGGSGVFGILVSVFGVGLAAVSLAADFDSIDRAVAARLPERYSWLLAHGLIVSLVWLYLELLRLLARMRD